MKKGSKMREEFKSRIEKINSGIVPDGYKKTKVGIVPVEWEVCKLSKFLEVNKEKNIQLKYDKSDVFSISGEYGIVNQIEFLGRSYAGASVEPYRIVYPENIVYTKSPLKVNPYGIIKSNQTSKTGIVSTLYAVYKCKENVISKYVEYYFGLDTTLNNYLLPLVNIGSKHDMKISDENVLKGYVCFPPLAEQQKIAEILSTQDKLIELHEKKVKKLKELKKAYLQKMFPQKGSKYPEIRFKRFNDAWEQRELGEVVEDNQKPVPKPDGEYIRLGIRSHAKGTFHEVVPAGGGLDVDTMYVVEANNLIVNITFAWEEAWAITTDEDAEKLVSHRFPQYKFKSEQYPIFYKYRFNNSKIGRAHV